MQCREIGRHAREIVRREDQALAIRTSDPRRGVAGRPLDVHEVGSRVPRLLQEAQTLLFAAPEMATLPGRPAGHDDTARSAGQRTRNVRVGHRVESELDQIRLGFRA